MYNDPTIDDEYERQMRRKGAGAAGAGALAGAGTGALIGSVVPGIGTAIGAVVGGAIGGVTGVLSSKKRRHQEALAKTQLKRASELERNLKRPVYTRPGEITQALNLARQTAQMGLPQESQDLQQSMLDRSLTYSLGQMESRKTGLMGLGGLYQTSADAANQMASADAQARLQGRAGWQSALQNAATYADREFEYNKDQPYQMALKQIMALQGAGLQNMSQVYQQRGQAAMKYAALAQGLGMQAAGTPGLFGNKQQSSTGGQFAPID